MPTPNDTASATGDRDRLLRRLSSNLANRVAAAWIALYILIAVTGQRFDIGYLQFGWQLVPYEELRARPLTSVWYLHIQPPLWNLMIGLVGRWSPLPDALSLQLIMVAFGAIATWCLCALLLRLGCPRRWAAALTIAAMASPDVLNNAFVPTYELAVSAMLAATALAIAKLSDTDRPGRTVVVIAALLTMLALTRTVYPPLFVAVVLGLVMWGWRRVISRRAILVAVLVPTLLLGGWMAKNQYIVGRFTMSTWTGMNLHRAVIPVLDRDKLQRLSDDGEISDVALQGSFGSYRTYETAAGPCIERTGVVVLDQLQRGPEDVPNFNAKCYLAVYDLAGADARTVARAHPAAFLEGRVWGAKVYWAMVPNTGSSESPVLRGIHDAYQVAHLPIPGRITTKGWGTPLYGDLNVAARFSGLLIALSIALVWSAWRQRRSQAAVVFVGGVVLYTFLVGITFELGEQARFRSMLDPIVLAVGGFVVVQLGSQWRDRQRHADAVGE